MQNTCTTITIGFTDSGEIAAKLFSICKNITIGREWVLLYTKAKIIPKIEVYTICIGCTWNKPNNKPDTSIGKIPPLTFEASLNIIPLKTSSSKIGASITTDIIVRNG